jgi:hypothetical protein
LLQEPHPVDHPPGVPAGRHPTASSDKTDARIGSYGILPFKVNIQTRRLAKKLFLPNDAWHKAFSLVVATLLCNCRADPPSHTAHGRISLEVTNSLAVPNHRVQLSVSGDQLSVTRQNNDGAPLETSRELTAEELAAVWTFVDAVNWSAVKKDKVLGLDGTTYRISLGNDEFNVWTPDSDTESRDLTRLIELKTLLWRIAEIKQGEQAGTGQSATWPESK